MDGQFEIIRISAHIVEYNFELVTTGVIKMNEFIYFCYTASTLHCLDNSLCPDAETASTIFMGGESLVISVIERGSARPK
jgi:hypothetical protein